MPVQRHTQPLIRSANSSFVRDINGLRAIAVVAVVLFHFFPTLVPGGFVGVDVFFVISGYLMTKIILEQAEKGTFSIVHFYIRRAQRLAPALIAMVLIVMTCLWFFLYTVEYMNFAKHALSTLLLYSNFVYWQEAGYFTANAHENWLLHTWSLSAEWQFYLIYPLTIYPIFRFLGAQGTRYLMVLGFVCSFSLSVFTALTAPDAAYFLLPTRAWQMLLGGLVFLFPLERRIAFLPLIGISLITYALFTVNATTPWPGLAALLPTVGAALILSSGVRESSLPQSRLMANIGLSSYSIYLWHWPINVALHNMAFDPGPLVLALGLVVSMGLGWLSYMYIEQLKTRLIALPCFVLAVTVAYFIEQTNGAATTYRPISRSSKNAQVTKYHAMNSWKSGPISDCSMSKRIAATGVSSLAEYCLRGPGAGGLFLWGDSHMGAWSSGIRASVENLAVSQVTSSGCTPTTRPSLVEYSAVRIACNAANTLAIKKIAEIRPKIVILAQKSRHEHSDWTRIESDLIQLGVRDVLVLGPVPQWYPSVPVNYFRYANNDLTLSTSKLDKSLITSDKRMESIAADSNTLRYLSILTRICNQPTKHDGYCTVIFNDELISFDYGHLTETASKYLAEKYVRGELSSTSIN